MNISIKQLCFFTTVIITSTFLQADLNQDNGVDAGLMRTLDNNGDSSTTQGVVDDNIENSALDSYMDTVIYNDTYRKASQHGEDVLFEEDKKKSELGTIKLASPRTDYIKEQVKNSKRIALQDKNETSNNSVIDEDYFVGGYCIAGAKTSLIRSSGFGSYDCELNFGNQYVHTTIFAGVYPDYKREMAIGLPIYLSFDNGKRASFNGIMLNANKTSLNIANTVETYKIRKMIAKGGLAISDVAFKYSTAYFTELQRSRVQESVVYTSAINSQNGVNVPIPMETRKVAIPKIQDYLVLAGIGVFDRLFAIGAENMMENTDPLFTIAKGQRVWVEGMVRFKNSEIYASFGKINEEQKKTIKSNNNAYNINNNLKNIRQVPNGSQGHTLKLPTLNSYRGK